MPIAPAMPIPACRLRTIIIQIGANRGYIALASDPALVAAVNKALAELQAEGKVAEYGKEAGLTYLLPHELAILDNVWEKNLQQ